MKTLNNEGLAYFFGKLKTKFVSAEPGKRLITEAEATKLASVPARAKELAEQSGVLRGGNAGWNSFTYPVLFGEDVTLVLTPNHGNIELSKTDRAGFIYIIYNQVGNQGCSDQISWRASVISEGQLSFNIAKAAQLPSPLNYLTLSRLFASSDASKIMANESARKITLESSRAVATYLCYAISLPASNYPDMTSLREDSVAMTAVAASNVAMTAVAASNVAMTAVAASNVAMTAVINSTVALPMVVNSNVAMTAVAASNVAMTAVAASNVAITAVVNSNVAIRLIALSNTAKSAVIRENARLQLYRLQIYTTVKNSPSQFKLISSLQSVDVVTQANRVSSNYIVFATVGQYSDTYPGSATMYHGHNGSTIVTRDYDCDTSDLYVGLGGATFTEYNDGCTYLTLYEAIV